MTQTSGEIAKLARSYREDPAQILRQTQLSLLKAEAAVELFSALSAIDPEGSQRSAAESARRYEMGQEKGLLDGIPVTVKDSFHVKGLPRWHGSAVHRGALSTFDSAPVQRLREAGAVIIGKTSMPDFGMLAAGLSSQFGIIRNPWDPDLSPGGSSAGAGASLASGVTAVSLGTDIAGSVRLPAAHCGLASLKPTQGRIAYAPASMMRSAGPMARYMADVRHLLRVVGGPDRSDPWCLPPMVQADGTDLPETTGRSVAVVRRMGYGPDLDEDTSRVLDETADALRESGFDLTAIELDVSMLEFESLDRVLQVKAYTEMKAAEQEARHRLLPAVGQWCAPAASLKATSYAADNDTIMATVARITELTRKFDYLLLPVMPVHSFPAHAWGPGSDGPLLLHAMFTAWFNQTGQPAAVVPGGTAAATGLPVGVQIVGRRFDDEGTMRMARIIEEIRRIDLNFPFISLSEARS
ncbi:amidase family protein [Arthrobacter sp. U41]|uniref:amidase family protein n=1 Tax=Arthrobacter sp. U41 TaxID=1849032 RepID=UPI0008593723|nr:amidase family protein [Arthrobacter sp. U41]AOT05814.1 hypothetical protein ASPU41_20490 [Arthrobacter sp. U41]